MDNTVGSLTQKQKSVIIGSLLGDGYLRKIPGRQNAFLEINHSFNQKQYVDWKYNVLKNIVKSPPKRRDYNGRSAYRFFTRQHRELSQLYNIFYYNSHKIIPDISLDPLILSVWFMDDGSKVSKDDVYLNTQQFSKNDQLKLLNMLKTIGLEARLNKDKQYFRIRFLKSSLLKFNEMIEPFVVPSMIYKVSYDPVETCPVTKGQISSIHLN